MLGDCSVAMSGSVAIYKPIPGDPILLLIIMRPKTVIETMAETLAGIKILALSNDVD
jgi:hypothetical protein